MLMHLYASVASFSNGKAEQYDWSNLCSMVNHGTEIDALCYQGSYASTFSEATQALKTCGQRSIRVGKFGFTGPEMAMVKEALDLHEQQLQQVSRNQFNQAVDIVTNKFRKGDFETVIGKLHAVL